MKEQAVAVLEVV